MIRLKATLSRTTLILFLVLAFPWLSWGWQGKVVGVSDGDTITVMHDGKGEKIRLYGIDCPEKRQDYGTKAKEFTSIMVFGKTVDVEPAATDRYGRTVGLVTVNGQSLHRELIKAGLAWVYTRYCDKSECREWKKLEEQARNEKVGLWSIPDPTPPWAFRHPSGKLQGEAGNTESSKSTEQSSLTAGVYHGNTSSHVFHRPGCKQYGCKNCTALFSKREEAIKAGYKACGICKP